MPCDTGEQVQFPVSPFKRMGQLDMVGDVVGLDPDREAARGECQGLPE